jgi:hypothetical protein
MAGKRGLVLVLIAVAAAALVLVLQPVSPGVLSTEQEKISFAGGFGAMNALFEKHSVPLFAEVPSEEKVISLSQDSLNALSTELVSYRQEISGSALGQDREALLKLNSIYLLELEYYGALKKNKDTPELDDSKDICRQLHVLRQNDADLQALVEASKNLNDAISGFMENHPGQNETAAFFPLEFDEKETAEAVKNQENSTAYFEEACGEVA